MSTSPDKSYKSPDHFQPRMKFENVIKIVEKPLMDLAGLISSFGGNLGLFAGMSLITIVQFFAHLIKGCGVALISKKQQKGQINPTTEPKEIYESSENPADLKITEEISQPMPIAYPIYHGSRPIHL